LPAAFFSIIPYPAGFVKAKVRGEGGLGAETDRFFVRYENSFLPWQKAAAIPFHYSLLLITSKKIPLWRKICEE